VKPQFQSISPGGYFEKDTSIELSANVVNAENALFVWYLDGKVIPGATEPTYRIGHLKPQHEGTYTLVASNPGGYTESLPVEVNVIATLETKSVARWWNEALLDGIRRDFPDSWHTVYSSSCDRR